MKTTLVNLRTYDKRYVNIDYVLIDRRTPYGNPFRIGDYSPKYGRPLTREDCVELFKVHFWCRMNEDASYRSAVERLRGKKLACWCTPLACHGDVYVEYFEGSKTIDGTEYWVHEPPDAADVTWDPPKNLSNFELMGFYDDK